MFDNDASQVLGENLPESIGGERTEDGNKTDIDGGEFEFKGGWRCFFHSVSGNCTIAVPVNVVRGPRTSCGQNLPDHMRTLETIDEA